ncbi:hypothetical protein BT69DRAFT_1282294 [Atractiella rhizophila]|nr:hypothetical protein BT69DRAFT_1282294 [Atractiella rhizophila]
MSQAKAVQAKAMNVFTDDGSFLERFKKLREEQVEKKQQDDALARKKAIDNRIKFRGKRKLQSMEESESKKFKVGEPENAYLKEVKKMSERTLRDEGSGVRPLVK